MAKRNFFGISLEDALETEKLIEQSEEAASNSGDFGVLLNNVKSQVSNMQQQRDNPVNQDGSGGGGSDYSSSDDSGDGSDDDSGDDGMGDDGLDMDMDMDAEGGEEDGDEGEGEEAADEETATEHAHLWLPATEENLFRELSIYGNLAALEDAEGYGARGWEALKTVGSALYVAGQALSYVGINVLWPAMKKLYKVCLYLGAKIIRYSFRSIKKIKEVSEEYGVRMDKLKQDIEIAKAVVAELKVKREEFPDSFPEKLTSRFSNKKVINRIKLGNEIGPVANTAILEGFLKRWYGKISNDITKDNAAIAQVLHYGVEASINPVKAFGDTSMRQGLVPDPRVNHDVNNGFVDAMRYHEVLPGDMVYCCVLPNGKSETIDDVRQAYSASDCSFAMDSSSFKRIDEIDYMNLDSVEKSLLGIEVLIKTLDAQRGIYEQIIKEKTSHLTKFKRYMLSLAESDKKVTLEQSMMEYIYLRGAFIDNVYTVTARDIHVFAQKYVANVMTYLGSNLEELSS